MIFNAGDDKEHRIEKKHLLNLRYYRGQRYRSLIDLGSRDRNLRSRSGNLRCLAKEWQSPDFCTCRYRGARFASLSEGCPIRLWRLGVSQSGLGQPFASATEKMSDHWTI